MKTIIFFLALSILLESTITTLPLSLLIIIFSAVVFRKSDVFILAFFAGLFLDIFAFRNIGWSSLYFTVIVYAVLMYQRKFEIETLHFVGIAAVFGSFIYLLIEGVSSPIPQSVICSLILVSSFIFYKKSNKKLPSYLQ